MNNNWDLHDVVKGCCSSTITSSTAKTNTTNLDSLSYLNSLLSCSFNKDDNFLGIREDPFEELYKAVKPFLPKPSQISPNSSSITTLQKRKQPQMVEENHKFSQVDSLSATTSNDGVSSTTYQPPMSKRRKIKHKKVFHVREDVLSLNIRTWRKYGQKSIKSSPYPRCYYRCSSSKGCSARKQVQRNKSDPKMFTVIYTSEHNHPDPADQNSLVEYTQQEPHTTPLVASAIVSSSIDEHAELVSNQGVSCASRGSSDEEELEINIENIESNRIEDQLVDAFDMDMSDDFFEGLEDFIPSDTGDCFSD